MWAKRLGSKAPLGVVRGAQPPGKQGSAGGGWGSDGLYESGEPFASLLWAHGSLRNPQGPTGGGGGDISPNLPGGRGGVPTPLLGSRG